MAAAVFLKDNMQIIHDSRNIEYRNPFGAAATGTEVSLSIKITGCDAETVHVEIRRDEENQYHKLDMVQASNGLYTLRLKVPGDPCLLWYRFRIAVKNEDGCHALYYCNNEQGLGGEGRIVDGSGELTPYQITVYRKAGTPDWYKNGIVYQIFPDRFARDDGWRERCEKAIKWVNDRRRDTRKMIEDDWLKPAYYERDKTGKVTGWPIYGGSLKGIEEKLDYLKSLGVSAIYLNPIFEATSNHRYDTGNYMKIDPALGSEEDFRHLAETAREKGIRLILDGVFSHTGADSIYFDRYGNYGSIGAWGNENSPYRSWYKFDASEKCGYKSWWGVEDLPEVDENNESYRGYILGEDGVVSHWLDAGASGWRLDVADELPDSFIKAMRARVKAQCEDNLLIGEVWEDASNKISYGERREYFAGDELDGTMNYPIRDILLDYINYTISSGKAGEKLMSLAENYPEENFYGALNLIGSHDRERILTMMAADKDYGSAVSKVRILSTLQYALPGVPCIYYGDEAGLMGAADPVNRSCYPWGKENEGLKFHYRMLGLIYGEHPALKNGSFDMLSGEEGVPDDVLAFVRADKEPAGERILVLANRSYGDNDVDLSKIKGLTCGYALDLMSSTELKIGEDGSLGKIHMDSLSVKLICLLDERPVQQKLDRSAGVICHLSSIDGALREGGKDFVDYIADAGFKVWQVLPVNPIGLGNSPYVSPSAFAGEPGFIDRSAKQEELDSPGFDDFAAENDYWLTEYAAFTLLKEKFSGAPWYEWPDEYKFGDPHDIVAAFKGEEADRVAELEQEQYIFYLEWQNLKAYAHSKGVNIMGDIPMYVGVDSADVWANKDIFQLDDDGRLRAHAGVPPDYFSEDGQDWGNPLYDWDALKKTGYGWWIRRLKQCAERYDILRIDHFRALSEYYAIPEGHKPKDGLWQHGPGMDFIKAVKAALSEGGFDLKLVAEDLGSLDAEVLNLIKISGLPGMNVWQFSEKDMMNMPEEEAENRAFYAGTHDNNTLLGYYLNAETKSEAEEAGTDTEDETEEADTEAAAEKAEAKALEAIRKIYESPAELAVVQLQDVFMLGEEARMNVPGIPEGNWSWKIPGKALEEAFPDAKKRAGWFRSLAEESGRC